MTALDQALAALDRDRLESRLVDLLRIPSVDGTPAEAEAPEWLAQQWQAEGLSAQVHELDLATLRAHPDYPGEEVSRERGVNATATVGNANGPHLLLLGHTDVVPTGDLAAWTSDPFEPTLRTRNGKRELVGRGTCDMKAGMVAAWEAVTAVKNSGVELAGLITLASVCGEEDGGLGSFGLVQQGLRPDFCVIPEPTSLALVPQNAGALTFTITVTGRAIHASRRAEGISAFEKFLPIYAALSELETQRNRETDAAFSRWKVPFALSIGVVRTGDWSSSVPDNLVAEGRLGVRPDESVTDAIRIFEKTISEVAARDEWLQIHPPKVEWTGGMFAPGHTPSDHPDLELLRGCHHTTTGWPSETYGAPYGSDLRLWAGVGVPTVQYGPGDVTYAHTADEWVDLDETWLAAQTFVRLILEKVGK